MQDLRLRYHHLLLSLAAGDEAGARRAGMDAWDRFGTTADPALANELAWIRGPVSDGAADSEVPVRLAGLTLDKAPAEQQAVLRQRLGGALYRARRYEESIHCLEEGSALSGDQALPSDWAFLSMAHFRLGQSHRGPPLSQPVPRFSAQCRP